MARFSYNLIKSNLNIKHLDTRADVFIRTIDQKIHDACIISCLQAVKKLFNRANSTVKRCYM